MRRRRPSSRTSAGYSFVPCLIDIHSLDVHLQLTNIAAHAWSFPHPFLTYSASSIARLNEETRGQRRRSVTQECINDFECEIISLGHDMAYSLLRLTDTSPESTFRLRIDQL